MGTKQHGIATLAVQDARSKFLRRATSHTVPTQPFQCKKRAASSDRLHVLLQHFHCSTDSQAVGLSGLCSIKKSPTSKLGSWQISVFGEHVWRSSFRASYSL